jgi:cell division transport system permease protein
MAESRGVATRRGLGTRVSAYVLRHAQVLVGSLGRIAEHPFSTAMTAAVIGVALALPAALHLLVVNGAALAGRLDKGTDVSVFLKREVDLDAARRVADRVQGRDDVEGVELIPADVALAELRARPGFGPAIEALEENPLPHVLVVRPEPAAGGAESMAALAAALRAMPEVELVQDDLQWIRRLNAMLEIVRRAVLLAGILLGTGVLAVVGNTIRLDIESRREEIVIVKLIGGTDAFVRRPFLYTGIWYGLAGGLIALAVVSGGLLLLRGPVEELAMLYGSDFALQGLGAGLGAAFPGLGVALGWAGSWIAAARHLRGVEPS